MAISDDENAQTIDNLLGLTSRKFFIFYAAIEPKKNLGRLMEAYLGSNSPYPLVVVGRKGWLANPELRPLLYEDVKTSLTGSKGRIVQLDYVSSELLVTLVRSARAVLFPSIYEGFGLPILESMMCGTPVMTANFGAMREVATAEAALLIDPFDIRDMSRAITALSTDDMLCARLSAAGRLRAEAFSWELYKSRVANAYARVMVTKRAAFVKLSGQAATSSWKN
jgi:glycosyltransferase involved in cell wall biosynthesis